MIVSSEQVGKGHPDKMADQISDIVLQTLLELDKNAKVACETMITSKEIIVRGEINFINQNNSSIEELIKPKLYKFLENLNYKKDMFEINIFLIKQSKEINFAINNDENIGAGDQGIMFGYATNETKEFLPLPYLIATKILKKIDSTSDRPPNYDSKSQVSFDYEKNQLTHILVSLQHKENIDFNAFKERIKNYILEIVREYDLNEDFELLINPSGSFIVGGPLSDVGLTGRKIIADSYGGFAKHGGGAFSGKDYTKVDRSASYMLRYIAKNIVNLGFAKRIEIQISYAIGISKPLTINVETFGTQKISDNQIILWILKNFNLTPLGIKEELKLDDVKNLDYTQTSIYGHFLNYDVDNIFPWEKIKTDFKVDK